MKNEYTKTELRSFGAVEVLAAGSFGAWWTDMVDFPPEERQTDVLLA
jgi:hypothetical protein